MVNRRVPGRQVERTHFVCPIAGCDEHADEMGRAAVCPVHSVRMVTTAQKSKLDD